MNISHTHAEVDLPACGGFQPERHAAISANVKPPSSFVWVLICCTSVLHAAVSDACGLEPEPAAANTTAPAEANDVTQPPVGNGATPPPMPATAPVSGGRTRPLGAPPSVAAPTAWRCDRGGWRGGNHSKLHAAAGAAGAEAAALDGGEDRLALHGGAARRQAAVCRRGGHRQR